VGIKNGTISKKNAKTQIVVLIINQKWNIKSQRNTIYAIRAIRNHTIA
jgi:hypothetical protein